MANTPIEPNPVPYGTAEFAQVYVKAIMKLLDARENWESTTLTPKQAGVLLDTIDALVELEQQHAEQVNARFPQLSDRVVAEITQALARYQMEVYPHDLPGASTSGT
jgi:hypothetical protein